jgi:hypothetical protein
MRPAPWIWYFSSTHNLDRVLWIINNRLRYADVSTRARRLGFSFSRDFDRRLSLVQRPGS